MSELRECPFCGGKAIMTEAETSIGRYVVKCAATNKCAVAAGTYINATEEGAISAWNTRHNASLSKQVDELKRALEWYADAGRYKAPLANNETYFDCGERARKALAQPANGGGE